MQKKVGIAVALLLAGIILWRQTDQTHTVPPRADTAWPDTAGATSEDGRQKESAATPGLPSSSIDAARRHVADAELALQAAVAERKAAEAEIGKAERDVEELERWIEGIEERGEDPVDYADEGLEKLEPAFFAYQQAFDRFELAETMESAASDELNAAKANLARVLAASEGEK